EASVISPRPNERLRMISARRAREADLDKVCSLAFAGGRNLSASSGTFQRRYGAVNSARPAGRVHLKADCTTLSFPVLDTPPFARGNAKMTIEFHTWNTPNGRKISVALEEMGLAYKVIPVNISKGEQMAPAFLAISPNNKIPAIVDPDGPGGQRVSIFESGAILLYLGEKTGKFLPK